MAIQLINIGNVANDGTGDDLREAFIKVNQNFEELDLRDDEQTSGSNTGNGVGVFGQRVNYDLQFKSLVAGTDVSITSDASEITISADGGLKALRIDADTGNILVSDDDTIAVSGGNLISTVVAGKDVIVNYTGWERLSDDPSPQLGGALIANGNLIIGASLIQANLLTADAINGNLEGTVWGVDIRDISRYFEDYWDFGVLGATYTSSFQWVMDDLDVDHGTFVNPDIRIIELGTIL